MQRLSLITICLAAFLLLSSCAGVPDTHYYTFQPTRAESSQQTGRANHPFALNVESFEGDVPYHQDKIVFRTSVYEINFYEYHRWLRPPTELVTEQTLEQLRASGLFRSVKDDDYDTSTPYVLKGQVLMFDQWYTEQKRSIARVVIRYRLFAPELEQDLLWDDTVETAATTPNMSILEVIKAFEAALHENIQQAIAAINRVVTQHTE